MTPSLVCYNGILITPTYGYGFCECGCGDKTKIPPYNNSVTGDIKGKPRHFLQGHQFRLQGPDYEIRDCGFKSPCWLWLKLLDVGGYARITIDAKNRRATHAYWQHYIGTVPEGKHLDHLCRVHSCVNPEHLEPVPPRANVRRGARALYTEDDIKRMMKMRRSGMQCKDIAKHFGAAAEYVSTICRGKRWQGIVDIEHLPNYTKHVTATQIEEMVRLRKTGLAVGDIATRLGVSEWNIYPILRRQGAGRSVIGRRSKSKPQVAESALCLEPPQTG